MTFDANRDLLLANDGGVYRLLDPNLTGLRRWEPVIGTLRATELHSVAYDPLGKVVLGGTQDNGSVVQSAPGGFAWNELQGGDGGVVAVDADQQSHPGMSIRYTSFQFLGAFTRTTWDAANNVLAQRFLRLAVASGSCAGRTLTDCDENVQFYNPYVLNAIDPSRMLLGTSALYESLNRGDTLRALTGNTGSAITGLAYGGRLGGADYPGIIYAGDGEAANGGVILHRINRGGTIMTLKYPGSAVRALAINPFDYRQIVVVDVRSRVWLSDSEGMPGTWANVTGNLASRTSQVTSIAFCSLDATLARSVLVAGGFGIFELRGPGSGRTWARLGSSIPNALFLDLHYDNRNDLLLAGSLGRGAWTLPGFLKGGAAPVAAATGAVLAAAPAPYKLSFPLIPPVRAAPARQPTL